MKYVTTVEGNTFLIEIRNGEIIVDGERHDVDLRKIEPLSLYSLLIDNQSHELFIEEHEGKHSAVLDGKFYGACVQEEHARDRSTVASAAPSAGGTVPIGAPMPGLVLEVLVSSGESTREGDLLAILESMKMRIEVRCPHDGMVESVHVSPDDPVTQGQLLLNLST